MAVAPAGLGGRPRVRLRGQLGLPDLRRRHDIHAEKLRRTTVEAAAALASAGRFRTAELNRAVVGAKIGQAQAERATAVAPGFGVQPQQQRVEDDVVVAGAGGGGLGDARQRVGSAHGSDRAGAGAPDRLRRLALVSITRGIAGIRPVRARITAVPRAWMGIMTVPAGRPGTSGDSALFDHASDRAGSPLGRHPGYARHAHRAGGAAEQDPGLGVRQLCDAACRALSPAINDPYTAIQATEHLSVLYAAYAARPVGDQVVRDPTRSVLVAVPARSFAENIALGLGLIRRFGAAEPSVIAAVLRLLIAALEATGAEPDRWAAIEKEADLLVTAAERKIVEPVDLQIVHRERAALEQLLQTRRATVREALG